MTPCAEGEVPASVRQRFWPLVLLNATWPPNPISITLPVFGAYVPVRFVGEVPQLAAEDQIEVGEVPASV